MGFVLYFVIGFVNVKDEGSRSVMWVIMAILIVYGVTYEISQKTPSNITILKQTFD